MKTDKLGPNAACFGATISEYGWSGGRYNPTDNPDKLGIEIEFEGVPEGGLVFNAPKGWAIHNDGSLRGGGELVSNGPRTIEEVDGDIDAVVKKFADSSFVPVFSFRTSLHVHVNINDLTHLQLLNMFALYTIFEQPMLELGGEERVGNVHCMPVFLAPYPLEELRRGLSGDTNKYGKGTLDNSLRNLMRNDMRYSSFNWASIAKFGTVEYRSHRGTLDKATIMRWCKLILHLKTVAKTYDNPQHIVQDFSRYGPLVFTQRTLPNDAQLAALCSKDHNRLWEGLRNVQMFAFATNDWRTKSRNPEVAKPDAYVIHDEVQINAPQAVDHWVGWNNAGELAPGARVRDVAQVRAEIDRQLLAARRRANGRMA